MAVISVKDLTKRFGGLVAVDNLSFTVEGGSVVGFLGPNGAGKTTTLRILLGLVSPSSGEATIDGRHYWELPAPLRVVGAVLETSVTHPGRSARNHLRIQALAGGANNTRIDEVLDLVGLRSAADRKTGEFSLGMRQRLGLATALLCDPEVVILDEPANGLDPEGVRWLRELLQNLAAEGRTVLISSHILAEVAQTVDSVIILNHGRLVTQATLAQLTQKVQQAVRIRTPMVLELQALLATRGADTEVLSDERLEVRGLSTEDIGTLAADHAIPIFETSASSLELEDIFFRLTEQEQSEMETP